MELDLRGQAALVAGGSRRIGLDDLWSIRWEQYE